MVNPYKVCRVILLGLIVLLHISCVSIDNFDYVNNPAQIIDTMIIKSADDPAAQAVCRRAMQISDVVWQAKGTLYYNNGTYEPEDICRGIPYSSVKEKDKFIGQEVSFYTFLTSLHNPKSIIYMERTNMSPYKGENCSLYYGTVCSMTVNYAIGCPLPYQSDMYEKSSDFACVQKQSLESMSIGDLLVSDGHVVMVLSVERKNKKIHKVDILESNAYGAKIYRYSYSQLKNRWKKDNWRLLRYLKISDSLETYVYESDKDVFEKNLIYNEDLCVYRGDKSCFSLHENVKINIMNETYSLIELYKNGQLLERRELNGNAIEFKDLPYGKYKARLVGDRGVSNYTSFEILDTDISISKKGYIYTLEFDAEYGIHEYVVICDETGYRSVISEITLEERLSGQKQMCCSDENMILKVFFKGDYGRVSNL